MYGTQRQHGRAGSIENQHKSHSRQRTTVQIKTLLCRRQFTLLLLKHQHNLLCPHLKAPELLGCKKDLQTTEVCVICGGFCHHTASISPEIFKHTMTSHTFISRKPKNGFNDSCFIQLDIILAFSLLIELTFSHIHT